MGCNNCGGIHGGIILWNLPEIPQISFEIPNFPKLPEIHLPCVKVLFVRIGDCKPKVDKDVPKDPSNTDEDPSTTQKPKSSESCSSTRTVSDCSIVCSASLTVTSISTQECSTTCVPTTSGCSASGTTITTTTTVSTDQPCGRTCSQCTAVVDSAPNIPLPVIAPSTYTIVTSAVPTTPPTIPKRALIGPESFKNDVNEFIVEIVRGTYVDSQGRTHSITRLDPKPLGLPSCNSNAIQAQLLAEPLNAAVYGLWGCTSIIIVSMRGVWLSHFFEEESFLGNGGNFEEDVIDAIIGGDGTQYMSPLGVARGNDQIFAEGTDPEAIIITPQDASGNSEYAPQIAQIQETLNQMLPWLKSSSVINYVKTGLKEARGSESATGKVLFQYDPDEYNFEFRFNGTDCYTQVPTARVWMGNKPDPLLVKRWYAEYTQMLLPDGTTRRRDVKYCPINSLSSSLPSSPPTGSSIASSGSYLNTLFSIHSTLATLFTDPPHDSKNLPSTTNTANKTSEVLPTEISSTATKPRSTTSSESSVIPASSTYGPPSPTRESSPQAASSPPPSQSLRPPYQTGTCNIHLLEVSRFYTDPVYLQFNISDGSGKSLYSEWSKSKWGDVVTANAKDTKLPYPVTATLTQFLLLNSRRVKDGNRAPKRFVASPDPPIIVPWEKWLIQLDAGSQSWNNGVIDPTKLPYCKVGDWDNGNFGDWIEAVLTLGGDSKLPVSNHRNILGADANSIEPSNGLLLDLLIANLFFLLPLFLNPVFYILFSINI